MLLTFSVLKKELLYTVANPARGLLNRERRTKKRKSGKRSPPPPPSMLLVLNRRKKEKKSRDASTCMPRRYAGLGPSRTRTGFFGSSTRPMGVASQNSTLPLCHNNFPYTCCIVPGCDVTDYFIGGSSGDGRNTLKAEGVLNRPSYLILLYNKYQS